MEPIKSNSGLEKKELLDDIENLSKKEMYFMFAEPVTWAWVAIQIGKGILTAIGAKIFESLFNKGGDFKSLIKNLLHNVDIIFTKRLEDAFITDAIDKAESTNLALKQYINVPTDNRLELIYNNSLYLVSRFDSFELRTFREYILASSVHLIALEEYYKKNSDEYINIIEFINQAKNHILDLNEKWKPLSDSRFKIKTLNIREDIRDSSMDDEMARYQMVRYYRITENGKAIGSYYKKKKVAKANIKELRTSRYQLDFVNIYINPSLEVIKLWDERISQLP